MEHELKFDRKRNRVKYCPCGRSNRDGKFAPYQGYENKGYCHSCGETFLPEIDKDRSRYNVKYEPPETSYHEYELVQGSMNKYGENNFVQYLKTMFTEEEVKAVILEYFIGTSKHWSGATVFWQIDANEKVRHGKIMLYDKTGHRKKENGKAYITSVRSKLKLEDYNLKQCLFGLHLINEAKDHTVAIVESEKTAIIMSLFMPGYIWMATGSKQGFKYEMLRPIKGYKIIAFPDKSEYPIWKSIATELKGFDITVSDFLEQTDYPNGTDLADVYIDQLSVEPTKEDYVNASIDMMFGTEVVTNAERAVMHMAEANPAIHDLITAFGLEPALPTRTVVSPPKEKKLRYKYLHHIPMEVKQGVIKAHTEGRNRAEIQGMFPRLTAGEINLILNPESGGADPSGYTAVEVRH